MKEILASKLRTSELQEKLPLMISLKTLQPTLNTILRETEFRATEAFIQPQVTDRGMMTKELGGTGEKETQGPRGTEGTRKENGESREVSPLDQFTL